MELTQHLRICVKHVLLCNVFIFTIALKCSNCINCHDVSTSLLIVDIQLQKHDLPSIIQWLTSCEYVIYYVYMKDFFIFNVIYLFFIYVLPTATGLAS